MKIHLAAAALLLPLAALHAQEPGASPASPAPAASPVSSPTPMPSAAVASASPANPPHAQPVRDQEIVTRLQIFLDQQNFGPGIIDGRWGEFTGKALVHYARAHNLKVTPDIYNELPLDSVYPIYTDYTITAADAKTVGPMASQVPEQAKQKRMPYTSLTEFLEERYHASPDFLAKLNPGKKMDNLKPGDIVRVPNVAPFKLEDIHEGQKVADRPEFLTRSIYISTKEKMLDLYDGHNLVASFPITPGSKTLPAPPGRWVIIGIVTLPNFRWDKEMLEHGRRSADAYEIPAGPNNPVGVLWTGLDKTGIGIHGTNNPETIGRAASHGCIRLANWDAIRFSQMVTKGMPVTIE